MAKARNNESPRSVKRSRQSTLGSKKPREARMKVSVKELRDITRRAILSYGYSEADAAVILDVLMYAQLRGNNQGVVKLIGPGIPKDPSARPVRHDQEGPTSALIDGGNNHAMVVVTHAVDL